MGALRRKDKRQGRTQDRDAAERRKAVVFGLPQIDRQRQFCPGQGRRGQNADAPRLDQPGNGGGAAGVKTSVDGGDLGSVIGDKFGAKGHQLQGQRRFSRPRRPDEKKSPIGTKGHA